MFKFKDAYDNNKENSFTKVGINDFGLKERANDNDNSYSLPERYNYNEIRSIPDIERYAPTLAIALFFQAEIAPSIPRMAMREIHWYHP